MSKFISKDFNLEQTERGIIIALLRKIIEDTSNSKIDDDEYFTEGIAALGRLILGLVHTGRIEFRISNPIESQSVITKINIH